MINNTNKRFWNILKGIGIISIVIGHSTHKLVPFVYLYHLALFFFIGGYLYYEEKYGDDPYKYFVAKLKSNWFKFFSYSVFFILIHNLLVKYGLIINIPIYRINEMVKAIINTSMFFGTETLSGALWFVPIYIFSAMLFELIIFYSRKLDKKINIDIKFKKDLFIFFGTIFIGLVGVYLNKRNISLMLHVQSSFLVVPFFYLGYFLRKYFNDLNRYLNIFLGFICLVILYYFAYKLKFRIDLSQDIISSFSRFHLLVFIFVYILQN